MRIINLTYIDTGNLYDPTCREFSTQRHSPDNTGKKHCHLSKDPSWQLDQKYILIYMCTDTPQKGTLTTSDFKPLLEDLFCPGHKDRIKIRKLPIQFILVGGNVQPLGGSVV